MNNNELNWRHGRVRRRGLRSAWPRIGRACWGVEDVEFFHEIGDCECSAVLLSRKSVVKWSRRGTVVATAKLKRIK